ARPVLPPEVRAEYRVCHTLATDTNDLAVLHPLLRRLTEELGRRLRRRGLAARRLRLRLDYVDYAGSAKTVPLPSGPPLDQELWTGARRALALAQERRTAIRTVTLLVDRLIEAEAQLELFAEPSRNAALQRALDIVTSDRSRVPRPGLRHSSPVR